MSPSRNLLSRGTDGSNPASSSGESDANRSEARLEGSKRFPSTGWLFYKLRRIAHARQPEGYAQSLAYHPDVRHHVAEMSADLEAARLITYRSAWLSDKEGPTAETTAALYRLGSGMLTASA
jgi:alkylation response protein AidB-like acyl-CoA dehydrogenase